MVFPAMRAGIVGRFGGSRESFSSPPIRLAVQPHPPLVRQSRRRRHPEKPLVKRGLVELWEFFNHLPRFSGENSKNCLFFRQGHKRGLWALLDLVLRMGSPWTFLPRITSL